MLQLHCSTSACARMRRDDDEFRRESEQAVSNCQPRLLRLPHVLLPLPAELRDGLFYLSSLAPVSASQLITTTAEEMSDISENT